MKKLLGVIVAGLLLLGFAGQGMAAFSTGDLIRVVYDSTYEYASDLGALSKLETLPLNTPVGDPFTGLAGTDYANMTVAYYVVGSAATTNNYDYLGAPSTAQPLTMDGSSHGTLRSNINLISTLYAGHIAPGYTETAEVLKATVHSFWELAEQNGAAKGTYAFFTSGAESSLASLASGGDVDFYLYGFKGATTLGTVGTLLTAGDPAPFDIRTYVNALGVGESEVVEGQVSGVPIPPSMLLFAPGLLGLIGLKRRLWVKD